MLTSSEACEYTGVSPQIWSAFVAQFQGGVAQLAWRTVSNSPSKLRLQQPMAYPGFFSGGVQQIQLRTEGRENGDLGVVAP
jgi:hypothetical protein